MSESPTLPSTDGDKKKSGRPSNAELEAREVALAEREEELNTREANMQAQFEAKPDRVSADEGIRQENTTATDSKATRRQMHQGKRLADTTLYEEMYSDRKLMWVNDLNGDVQRWIDDGAEPVPVHVRSDRKFEGITDKVESKWVRSVGGDDGMGGHFWVYLLMVDPEVYEDVKTGPEKERQAAINRAMHQRGRAGGDASDMNEGGPKLQSYAPHLPTGGEEDGFAVKHETVG